MLFPMHSESDRTLPFLDQPFRVFRNFFFRNIQKKFSRSAIAVATNLSIISEENVCDEICLIFTMEL